MAEEYYVYRSKDRFVIMDVKFPLITEQPAFTGTEEECEKWVEESKGGIMTDKQLEEIAEREYFKIPSEEKKKKFIAISIIFKFAFAAGYRYCEGRRLKNEN